MTSSPRFMARSRACVTSGVDHVSIQTFASSRPGGNVSRSADCLLHCPLRLRRTAGTPKDVRQPAERLALLSPLTQRPAKLDLLLGRFNRLGVVVGDVALDRSQME